MSKLLFLGGSFDGQCMDVKNGPLVFSLAVKSIPHLKDDPTEPRTDDYIKRQFGGFTAMVFAKLSTEEIDEILKSRKLASTYIAHKEIGLTKDEVVVYHQYNFLRIHLDNLREANEPNRTDDQARMRNYRMVHSAMR